MKACTRCKIEKDESEFGKRSSVKSGLKSQCKQCDKKLFSEWYAKNRDQNLVKKKKWIEENKEVHRSNARNWYKENKTRFNIARRKRNTRKMRDDHLFALSERCRGRVKAAFARAKVPKSGLTRELLGADWKTVCYHIESQFTDGMSWENRDEWHIDHIIPISSAKSEDEMKRLFHYMNLQPLWIRDNLKKGATHPDDHR